MVCQELWANLRRSCHIYDANCMAARVIWAHTLKRMHDLQETFPRMQVDLTFFESQEDLQLCKGGLSPAGMQTGDVVTIIHVHHCEKGSTNCTAVVMSAVILFMKAPIQSVIFGSPFPIFCYACAHIIDASTRYEILSKVFTTQAGVFQLKLNDLLTVSFNQMRNLS
uniref:Uncharacterized protein n=1 Tax=Globisporangium ultimum (strain ATCC 200006 / CBS 805.95 / DAOM BR144) TaxID=431595 RepID=K3WCP8_GLOUD